LVNNLNLKVIAPNGTSTYYGNNFSNGWSAAGGSTDTVNNVENVYLQSPASGTWTIEVSGYNVPRGPQPYALVVYGQGTLSDPNAGSGGGADFIYLPLLVKSSAASGGITNGDFESGEAGWTEYSLNGWDLILPTDDLTVTPHSGSWVVWLGGDYNEDAYIEQQVTVSASSPYLAFWHWIASEDYCGYDFGGVRINNTTVSQFDLCSSTNTEGWVKRTVNLSAYSGQTVSLQIRVATDSSYNSNLFIDDVSFQTTGSTSTKTSESPTPDPTHLILKSGDMPVPPDDVDKSDKKTN
jgi:hypothetical protein